MPTGTHDVPAITVAVPDEYVSKTEVENIVSVNSTEESKMLVGETEANNRYAQFVELLRNDFYANITRVKTVGESMQTSTYQFTFVGENGCLKAYNAEEQLITWTISTADGAYLIDTTGETVYTAEHFDMSTREDFVSAYKLESVEFTGTANEAFEGAMLICDTYVDKTDDTVYKYYYDVDDNVIVIAKQKNDVQTHTLFNDLRTVELDETVFEIPDYKQEQYAVEETTNN